MLVRTVDSYHGRWHKDTLFTVSDPRSQEVLRRGDYKYDQNGAPLIQLDDAFAFCQDGRRIFECYAWRVEIVTDNTNYSPDQCGDTEEDI